MLFYPFVKILFEIFIKRREINYFMSFLFFPDVI